MIMSVVTVIKFKAGNGSGDEATAADAGFVEGGPVILSRAKLNHASFRSL